jgi:hypothetical protein
MLREYWEKVDSLVEGELIRVISIGRMPPWDEICQQLNWRFHRVDGGYFTSKRHGFSVARATSQLGLAPGIFDLKPWVSRPPQATFVRMEQNRPFAIAMIAWGKSVRAQH